MTNMTPSTASEKKLTKSIQAKIGSAQDGILGSASVVDIAAALGADCWPLTIKLYNNPVIICEDITIGNPGKGCGSFKNSLSGSFSYQKKPCSILIDNGRTVYGASCHAHINKPESVLYRLSNGKFGIKRCLSSSELPNGVEWAVGGMGLLDMYDPAAEGFTGTYGDVVRLTNHTVLGVKGALCYLVYCKNMTGSQVNTFCRDKLKLDMAVMLDGGHVAAINGEESFAKINTSQMQYYMIQAK